MKREKRLKFVVSLIFTIGMLFILGGCGSGGGGGDIDVSCKNCTEDPGNTAVGTYTYNPDTNVLRADFTSSDFGNCGPSVGTSTSSVSITSDTMLQTEESGNTGTWLRTEGPSGNIVGTWTISEDDGTLTAIIGADGSLTVTGTIDCSDGGGDPSLVGTWELTDIQGAPLSMPSELSPNDAMVFTDSTYAVNIEGDCGVSGIYTSDVSSIWLTSTSQTGNTDSFCNYHDTPHRLGYSVTSSTLIITEGDVVITLTRQ